MIWCICLVRYTFAYGLTRTWIVNTLNKVLAIYPLLNVYTKTTWKYRRGDFHCFYVLYYTIEISSSTLSKWKFLLIHSDMFRKKDITSKHRLVVMNSIKANTLTFNVRLV